MLSTSSFLAAALVAGSTAQGEGPAISSQGNCVAVYGAFARAQAGKAPGTLRRAPGFGSIDFAARGRAVQSRLVKAEDHAIIWWRQGLEESFDVAADQEVAGKSPDPTIASVALNDARECDSSNGFTPKLFEQTALSPTPPVEPYWCAVNYLSLGLGYRANPQMQQQIGLKFGAVLAKHPRAADPVKGKELRDYIKADSEMRNRAVGRGEIKPDQMIATAMACDKLIRPGG